MIAESYDKNRNPIKKYEHKEWPFKTKKAEKKARLESEKENGRGWYYFEKWKPQHTRKFPWILRFHHKYYEYLKVRREYEGKV
jgi:hypothetical protein